MRKFVYLFPFVLIGAFYYGAQPNMAFGMVSWGFIMALVLGFLVKRRGSKGFKRAGTNEAAQFRASCVSLMGLSLMGAGLAGNIYFAAAFGISWAFLPFLLASGATILCALSGFRGYFTGPHKRSK